MEHFSIRLRQARKIMGLSLGKLAEKINSPITKQSLSRYEAGIMKPKADVLAALATALDISIDYFEGKNMNLDELMLRTTSHGQLSEEELLEVEAVLSFRAEQYLKLEYQSGMAGHFVNPLEGIVVSCLDEAIAAAELLREKWHCGDGPIPSILRLMERKGIKMIDTSLPERVMGLSTWADHQYPLVILDARPEKTTVERLRFTAGHELGHLLLTFPQWANVEQLCNQFSSFFLFPKKTFLEELGNMQREDITIEELTDFREMYGISIAAQIHEAWDLKLISHEKYEKWFEKVIKGNILEEGWGQYKFPETFGRERRMRAIIKMKENHPNNNCYEE